MLRTCLLTLPAFGGVELGDGRDRERQKAAVQAIAETMLAIQAIARALRGN